MVIGAALFSGMLTEGRTAADGGQYLHIRCSHRRWGSGCGVWLSSRLKMVNERQQRYYVVP